MNLLAPTGALVLMMHHYMHSPTSFLTQMILKLMTPTIYWIVGVISFQKKGLLCQNRQ